MWFHYLPVPDLIRGVQCSESSDVVHTSSSWDFRCSGVASRILIIGWAENDEQFTKKYEKDWTFSDVSGQRMHPLQQVTSYKKGQNIWQLLTFKMTRGWWPLLHCCFTSTETIRTIGDGEPRMATLIFTQLLSSDIPKILHIALVRIRSRRRDDKSPTLVVLTRIRRDCGSHSLGGGGQHELHRYRSLHLTPTPCCTQSQCLTTAWQRQGGWFEDGGEWLRMSGAGHHFGLGSQDGAGADAGYGSWQQLEHGWGGSVVLCALHQAVQLEGHCFIHRYMWAN